MSKTSGIQGKCWKCFGDIKWFLWELQEGGVGGGGLTLGVFNPKPSDYRLIHNECIWWCFIMLLYVTNVLLMLYYTLIYNECVYLNNMYILNLIYYVAPYTVENGVSWASLQCCFTLSSQNMWLRSLSQANVEKIYYRLLKSIWTLQGALPFYDHCLYSQQFSSVACTFHTVPWSVLL